MDGFSAPTETPRCSPMKKVLRFFVSSFNVRVGVMSLSVMVLRDGSMEVGT